jgi:lipoprotein-releasing system permease protein
LRIVPPNVRDIDPGFARHVEMVTGDFFVDTPDSIVIGAELASHLRTSVGQEVSILTLDEADIFDAKGILNPTHKRFVVQGIFRSGFYQYDLAWAFVGAPSTLRVGAVPTYGIKIANRFRDEFSSVALHNVIEAAGNSAEIESWRVYNRALFSALRMEKLLLSAVLGLVFLVVTYNILQSLKRQVIERSPEIGLLRALGASPWVVRGVFIWEGTLLGIVGATVGTVGGLLIACNVDLLFSLIETVANIALALLNQLPDSLLRISTEPIRIFSPETFYLLEIPIRLPFIEVFLIAAFTVVAPALSGLAATMKTSETNIIADIRAE